MIDSILNADPLLKKVAQAKKKYKVQIIYTQINRNADNVPSFKNFNYAVDSNNYFYPASTVKLPVSIFALEKIKALNIPGVNRTTAMLTDSSNICQKYIWTDSSSVNGQANLEHYIKKMFLVSDNNAFSRVFEFINPKQINNRLKELGHPSGRIVHRLDPACVGRGNRYYNPIRFVNSNYEVLYSQPDDSLMEDFVPTFPKLTIGKTVYNKKKKIISEGKDFSKSNYLSLNMIHQTLRNLIFWEFIPEKNRFRIDTNDQQFLVKHLGMLPRESTFPSYDTTFFYDSFKKYFMYGGACRQIASDSVRIFNIVGRAYGFEIDCAYIVNFESKTEFMLSAVIYTNKKNTFGSGKYEYESIGLPFLKELSLALYRFEKNRKKKNLPDLDSVNFYKTP